MKYKMFVFDMDGTFIDSRRFHADVFYELFNEYWKPLSHEFCNTSMGATVKHIFDAVGIPEEEHSRFYDLLNLCYEEKSFKYLPETSVPLFFKELLDYLHEKGLRLAVITNSLHQVVDKFMEYHALKERFDDILGADASATDKVSRCKALMDKYGLLPEEIVYVGDMESDMELARKMGFAAFFAKIDIAWYKDLNYIEKIILPELIFEDYAQLRELLEVME